MAIDEYLQHVADVENEGLNDLFSRMDKDKDLYRLKPFTLLDKDEREKSASVRNITLNDPLTFARRSIAQLAGAIMQVSVEGDDLKEGDDAYIEAFIEAVLSAADARLSLTGFPPLRAFLSEQLAVRGPIAARCLTRIEGDDYVADIRPVDSRYMAVDYDGDGMSMACVTTQRSRRRIEAEYGIQISETTAIVRDFWDRQRERVYVAEGLADERPNPAGYVPFVYEKPTIGSHLWDSDNGEYQAECLFAAARGLYPEKNRLASILATLNEASIFHALQFEVDDPASAKPPSQSPWGFRRVFPVSKGGGYKAMPYEDMKRSTSLLYSIIDGAIQRATLPNLDYGNLRFPMSAVAISKLTSSKDLIYVPMLQCLAVFLRKLVAMFTRQFLAADMAVDLGEDGKKQQYTAAKLKEYGDYMTFFEFHNESTEQNIANLTIAAAAEPYLDEETILTDVIKVQDPAGVKRRRYADLAEKLVPTILFRRMARAKVDEGEDVEAKLVAEQMDTTLAKMLEGDFSMPESPQGEGDGRQRAGELMPLLEGPRASAGGRTSQQISEEESIQLEAEGGEETRE